MLGLAFKWNLILLGGELHLSRRYVGENPVKVSTKVGKLFRDPKTQKWMWIGVAAFIALQVYFVQELIVVFVLFTGLFVVCALIALVLYLVDRASRWGLSAAGHQAKRAMVAAEEISKKQLRRPRSEPAQ
jgi:hypothetical protein